MTLDDGERLRYDRLLLTTGAEPRRLRDSRAASSTACTTCARVDDCDVLRERLDRGGRVVVVGAGWIGAEVAASARQRGLEVTVIDPHAVPLERVLGAEVGAVYRDIHADHGVQMLIGRPASRHSRATSAVERVRTTDGRDARVRLRRRRHRRAAAHRARRREPASPWTTASSSTSSCRPARRACSPPATSPTRYHPFYGERIRVEHWANALNQGPAAARNMLGRAEAYDRLPYFFSDQYDVGMEYSGFARDWERVVFRGDPRERRVHRVLAARTIASSRA